MENNKKEKEKEIKNAKVFVINLTVQKIADGASLNDTRASPKSHIFSLQSALAKIFLGFKSR